jgi:hypothetical protein
MFVSHLMYCWKMGAHPVLPPNFLPLGSSSVFLHPSLVISQTTFPQATHGSLDL